jgi:uncharacterized protein (TIRG00374 family)
LSLKNLQSKRIILFLAFGIAAFVLYLYYFVGIGNFFNVIAEANLSVYALAFVAFVIGVSFSSLTWHSLLRNLNVKAGFRRVLLLTWAGYLFDTTLPEPGWSGDISKAYMLGKKSDEDVGKIVASVVSQKIIGMAFSILILIAGFSLLAINYVLPSPALFLVGFILVLSVGSLVVVYYVSTSPKATKRMLNLLIVVLKFILRKRFDEAQFRTDAEKFLNVFHKGIVTLGANKRSLLRPILFYFFSLVFDISVIFFVFYAIGYPIPFDTVLIVYALTGTIQAIGVSFFGVTETIMSLSYTVLFIPPAVSVSVTLLSRVITLWFKLILGYIAFQIASVGLFFGGKKKEKVETNSKPNVEENLASVNARKIF